MPSAIASMRLRGPCATSPPAQIVRVRRPQRGRVDARPPCGRVRARRRRAGRRSAAWPTARMTVSAGAPPRCRATNVGAKRPARRRTPTRRDRLEPGDPAVADEAVRAPSVEDRDALALGLGDLLGVGGDLLGRLQGDDGDVVDARRTAAGPTSSVVVIAGGRPRRCGRPPVAGGASPPAAARSAVRAASKATLPPPTTTTRSPRSTRKPWLTLSRNSTARQHAVELVAGQVEVARPARCRRPGTARRGASSELGRAWRRRRHGTGADVDARARGSPRSPGR